GEEREGVHEDRSRPGDAARDRERRAREVDVTGLAVKGDGNGRPLARQATEREQEVQVPGRTAQLPVGDPVEPDGLLKSDHLANRLVLGGPELSSVRAPRPAPDPEALARSRADPAADLNGR